MNFKHVKIVWGKELLDTIRDRRTLVMMIVLPLALMPIFVLGPSLLQIAQQERKLEQAQKIAVLNGGEAPGLLELIRRSGRLEPVELADLPPEQALLEGEVAAVLVLPEGFAQKIAAEADPPEVMIQFDVTSSDSRAAREKLSQLLEEYKRLLVGERLRQRGLPTTLVEPFLILSLNVAPEGAGGLLLSLLLPFFLVLWAAFGGSQTAIDVSAGEKERGTLETLLVTPPKRASLIVGKFLTVTTVTLGAIALALTGFALSFQLGTRLLGESPFFAQLEFALSLEALLLIFAVTALLAAMMSALTFSLYAWTRNFREAQTYATYISFLVMVPAIIVMFLDPPTSLEAFLIPVYNTAVILKELILGELELLHLAVTLISSVIYSGLSLWLAVRVFQSERVLFRQ